jgi:hypothetical protein
MTMDATERRKLAQVKAMDTEALRRIVDTATEHPATQAMPLAGNVTIQGIGMVSIAMLRREVESR